MKTERGNAFTLVNLSEKESKNLLVFDLIRSRAVVSRTDISKDTGINMVSISNYTKSFVDSGLLYDRGPDVSTGGRKPELMELASGDAGVIGITLNGPDAEAVLTDLNAKTLDKKRAPAADIISLSAEISAAAGSKGMKIKAVGVGSCGSASPELLGSVSDAAKAPTFTGSNICCAAFAERALNAGASSGNMLYVRSSLAECVLIKDGELVASGDERWPEAGYLRPWGEKLSAENMAKKEVARGVGTKIVHIAGAEIKSITEDSVIEAMKQDDEVASGIISSVAVNMGLRIAYLINIFTPKAVVIGGGIEKAGDALISGIKKMVARLAHASIAKKVSIVPSALGPDGPALGAAALAVRELFLRS